MIDDIQILKMIEKCRKVVAKHPTTGYLKSIYTDVDNLDTIIEAMEAAGYKDIRILVLRWTPLMVTPEAIAWMEGRS